VQQASGLSVPAAPISPTPEDGLNVNRKWWRSLLVVSVAAMLVLAACSNNDGESPSEESDAPASQGGEAVTGEIVNIGSSTVEPIMSIALEDFTAANPDVTYEVDGPGTSDGFAIFCEDGSDIANASRPIDEEEAAICADAGIEYVELKIGIDGLSVITSPENSAVTCLGFGDLYSLFGPESVGFENWSDADALAGEVGGDFGELHAPYEEASLDITAPGEESGTYGSFIEIALGDPAEARVEAGAITEEEAETLRPDYQASADDNVIIENIGGSPSSLGFVGFAFADQNADSVKTLEVDGGEGCVAPSAETISSGEYPIARDLFIYVNKAHAEENAAVVAFVDWLLTDGIGSVEEADYIPLDDEALQETVTAWEGR
jgi:phosphate transport system substrate-binding protein